MIVVLLSTLAIVWTPGLTRTSEAGPGNPLDEAPVAVFAGGQPALTGRISAYAVGVDAGGGVISVRLLAGNAWNGGSVRDLT